MPASHSTTIRIIPCRAQGYYTTMTIKCLCSAQRVSLPTCSQRAGHGTAPAHTCLSQHNGGSGIARVQPPPPWARPHHSGYALETDDPLRCVLKNRTYINILNMPLHTNAAVRNLPCRWQVCPRGTNVFIVRLNQSNQDKKSLILSAQFSLIPSDSAPLCGVFTGSEIHPWA